MNKERSKIQSYYKNKTIFITGATGFMGKVLLEKLLYSCSTDKIYVLIRDKRGQSCDIRLSLIFDLPLFYRIKMENPKAFDKVIPLNGDIFADNLGLTEEQLECLINEVHVVFNCAASTRLGAKLKYSIESNTLSTKRVLDLAKKMKQLECFLQTSTAFCHIEQKEVAECSYDSLCDPYDVMRLVQWLDEETIDLITPKLIYPHPNCYTFSKHLAETLVVNEYPNLPCCIARPSIVTPASKDPLPGWIDSLNGPMALLAAVGKGLLRSWYCKIDCNADIIPVDFAINHLIVIAQEIGTCQAKSKSIPVFNITQGKIETTYNDIWKTGGPILYEYPFERQIWYPCLDTLIHSNKFVHDLLILLFQIIPAYLIDFLMLIFRQRRFMVRIQKQILAGLNVFQYFIIKKWTFYNNKSIKLFNELSPKDKITFQMFWETFDKEEYYKNCCLGVRQYCMKEDPSSLPTARRRQKIMYVIHITTVYLFYFGILYYMYNTEIVRISLGYIGEKLKLLPIIGNLLEKTHL